MRNIITSLITGLAALLATSTHAQTTTHTDSVHAAGYLFTDFIEGSVLLKSGSTEKAQLNYNTNNQTVSFMQGGQYMELTGLENIDTVYIDGNKFIPYHEKFYKVVTATTDMPLLALVNNKPIPQSAAIEHSGLDKRSSNTVGYNATGVYSNRNFKSRFELTYQKQFFLQKGKLLLKAGSQQDIINAYPDKKEAIRSFVKNNKTNFYQEEDLVALLAALK